MSPDRLGVSAAIVLVAAPVLPFLWDTPLAYVLYLWVSVSAIVLIVGALRGSYDDGFRAGERAHRLKHLAEVIRLPNRRAS